MLALVVTFIVGFYFGIFLMGLLAATRPEG